MIKHTSKTSKCSSIEPIDLISEKTQTMKVYGKINPVMMKVQALQLQVKLFGLTSMLLQNQNWLSYVHQQQGYTLLPSNKVQWKQRKPHCQKPLGVIAWTPNLAPHVPCINA